MSARRRESGGTLLCQRTKRSYGHATDRLPLGLTILCIATNAPAATLTITPDQSIYQVGESITLSVFGDPEGMPDNRIHGRLLFDASLAEHVSSSQSNLTSFGGSISWITGILDGGPGFGEAFAQIAGVNPLISDGPLSASVELVATAPGVLVYEWQTEDNNLSFNLDFFGLTIAPEGTVTIIPEPATGSLLAIGLLILVSGGAPRRPWPTSLSARRPRL